MSVPLLRALGLPECLALTPQELVNGAIADALTKTEAKPQEPVPEKPEEKAPEKPAAQTPPRNPEAEMKANVTTPHQAVLQSQLQAPKTTPVAPVAKEPPKVSPEAVRPDTSGDEAMAQALAREELAQAALQKPDTHTTSRQERKDHKVAQKLAEKEAKAAKKEIHSKSNSKHDHKHHKRGL